MSSDTTAELHAKLSEVAAPMVAALLEHFCARLRQDGFTQVSPVELEVAQVFAGVDNATSYGVTVEASCFGGECLTLYAGFSSGYIELTRMHWHDFGLTLENSRGDVLFETPLQTWQGPWTADGMQAMLQVAMDADAAARIYADLAESLTH